MAYSSLFIHTHVASTTAAEGKAQNEDEEDEGECKDGATRTTTTHIYAEDMTRTHTKAIGALPGTKTQQQQKQAGGVDEKVTPPIRSKRRRSARQRRAASAPGSAGSYKAEAERQAAAAASKLGGLQPRGLRRLEAAMARAKVATQGG
jgi:hypothetical protein